MKNKLLSFIVLIIFTNCANNKYERRLLGNWYDISEKNKVEFTDESVIILDDRGQNITWKADKSKIIISEKSLFNDSIEKRKLNYQLVNDNLLILYNQNNILIKDSLIRAKSFLDFILKKYNSNINIENNPESKYLEKQFHTAIKIFLYPENGKIITKTEYSNNLKNLDNDISNHLEKINDRYKRHLRDYESFYERDKKSLTLKKIEHIRKNWVERNICFYLFTDKNTPQKSVDNCINKLKKNNTYTVYQIYHKDENPAESDFTAMKGIEK